MTRNELTTAIHQLLAYIPDDALPEVLNYLRESQPEAQSSLLSQNLERIISEDRNLLKRLAQ